MADGQDPRLFTVRNIEAFERHKAAEKSDYEFEVFVEVPVVGTVDFGPYRLVPWDAEPAPPGTTRSLVLSLSDYLGSKGEVATKGGFYHGIGMPDEFCALATTLLRRRFWLGPMIRMNNTAMRVRAPGGTRNLALISGDVNVSSLKAYFEQLAGLPAGYHEAFILACRMYQEALALIDSKRDLAYLLLVSCVEVFVAKFCATTTEADLSPEILAALSSCEDVSSRERLRNRILELDKGISRNFVTFVIEHVRESFWDGSPKLTKEQGRVMKDELPRLLKRIYNQRSKTLHEARPFPPNVLSPPNDDSEIDRRSQIVLGQRRWTESEFIPYVRFFERLVQHVLLTFVAKKSSKRNSPPNLRAPDDGSS